MLTKLRSILYRGLQILLLALLVYGFAQTLPYDLALLFAGDMLLYVEVATAVWLAAQVTRVRAAFVYGRILLGMAWRGLRRSVRRASRNAVRRLGRREDSDEERPWGQLVTA